MSQTIERNFREMRDDILSWYKVPPHVVDERINAHLSNLSKLWPWSGLITSGILEVPAEYKTGTVTLTNGSNLVTGTLTVLTPTDKVNTTLSTAITETGMRDATPVAMTNIEAGTWVLIEPGGANEESVFVISTDTTTFRARFTKTHTADSVVTRSSYAGRQFRTTSTTPWFTVTGVRDATHWLLDRTWANADVSSQAYSISQVFASFGRDVRQLLTVVNISQRYRFTCNYPKAYLDTVDPNRTSSGNTYMAVFHESDPGGAPLYEFYPRPTSQQAFPFMAKKFPAKLEDDDDILPSGIPAELIKKLTKADVAIYPDNVGTKYYNPEAATRYLAEAQGDLKAATVEDGNTAVMQLLWNYLKWPAGGGLGADWNQDHDIDAWLGNI